jgi:Flp pilus assembly pilin Flp
MLPNTFTVQRRRKEIGIGLLLAAGAVALVIALATVGTQALRAARTDPATVLRSE